MAENITGPRVITKRTVETVEGDKRTIETEERIEIGAVPSYRDNPPPYSDSPENPSNEPYEPPTLSLFGDVQFIIHIWHIDLAEQTLDILWVQPIKLIQVVSTSEIHEYWWNNIDFGSHN